MQALLCIHGFIVVRALVWSSLDLLCHGLQNLLSNQLEDGALQHIGLGIPLHNKHGFLPQFPGEVVQQTTDNVECCGKLKAHSVPR